MVPVVSAPSEMRCASLFILKLFSLAMQKLFTLKRSHLFILSFMSLALRDISVKILLRDITDFLAYVLLYDFNGVTTYISVFYAP